ncbi:MAG: hypothetical protein JWP95_1571 [Actinotalea sp.]|nr:hypothetical protein [Actinotalea sp.]
MATFSSVTRHHVLQALAEYDARGGEEFLDVYGFRPAEGHTIVHEGHAYESKAVLGVAHRFATGRLATSDEVDGGMHVAVAILRKRGFEVTEPATVSRTTPVRATRSPRAPSARSTATRSTATRSAAAREASMAICPTCSMTLPATGVCDTCG